MNQKGCRRYGPLHKMNDTHNNNMLITIITDYQLNDMFFFFAVFVDIGRCYLCQNAVLASHTLPSSVRAAVRDTVPPLSVRLAVRLWQAPAASATQRGELRGDTRRRGQLQGRSRGNKITCKVV